MKKATFLTIFLVLAYATCINAETYCQSVNKNGVNKAPQLAISMNKLLRAKGASYKTSAKEMKNVISSYCQKNPYATEDDTIKFLNIMADTVAAGEKMK